MRGRACRVGALLAVSLVARPALGQSVRVADSLLHRGVLDRAESEYYAASRARPRDPQARFALGQFLAARGALRIGATLIEEAIQFGYDKRSGNATLAPIYSDLGEYEKLARLTPSPLAAGELARTRWLTNHVSRLTAPDSSVLVALARVNSDGFLGATRIRINGRPIVAQIAPQTGCGIRLADTSAAAAKLHLFPPASGAHGAIAAAADSVGFGRMSITNVPISVEPIRNAQAIICLGMLSRFAPTFDPRAALMTFHLTGVAPKASAISTEFPLLVIDGQYTIAQGGGWAPLLMPQVSTMLNARRWTLDQRRGQITVEP